MGMVLWGTAEAAVETETLAYRAGETSLRGYLAWDDAREGKQPGIVIFPEWWGMNEYVQERARALAEIGYVALAADMYGEGKVAADATEAGQLTGQFRGRWEEGGRELMRERAAAAVAALAQDPRVDAERIAAIGYCFGGTCALEAGYSGAPVVAVVSFHGGLTAPVEKDLPALRAHFLILHGADDPTVRPEAIEACQEGLRRAKVDWQMVYYGGAVHAFTNPANANSTNPASAYHEVAARRAWVAMRDFLAEVFATQ
jgi:dienelactone hydrolase